MSTIVLDRSATPRQRDDGAVREFGAQSQYTGTLPAPVFVAKLAVLAQNISSSATSSLEKSEENELNETRLEQFRSAYARKIALVIRDNPVEFGASSPIEGLIEKLLGVNRLATLTLIQELFVDRFRKRDTEVLVGLLVAVSRLPESIVGAQGKLMAVNALHSKNIEVKEAGMRVFESWKSTESVELLTALDIKEAWLRQYRDDVVEYIQNAEVAAGKKN
jgi:hypothetical protein